MSMETNAMTAKATRENRVGDRAADREPELIAPRPGMTPRVIVGSRDVDVTVWPSVSVTMKVCRLGEAETVGIAESLVGGARSALYVLVARSEVTIWPSEAATDVLNA
jgi:hypothetical protein